MNTSVSSSTAQAKSSGSKAHSTAATLTPLQQALKKQQQAADQAAAQSLTQHEQRLNAAMTAALDTFKRDISNRKLLLMNLIGWPVLALSLCTLLAVGGVWTYWKMASPWDVREAPNGVKFRVLKGDWTPCNPKDKNSPLCQLEP